MLSNKYFDASSFTSFFALYQKMLYPLIALLVSAAELTTVSYSATSLSAMGTVYRECV